MPEEILKQKELLRRFETPAFEIRKDGDKRTLSFPASSEMPVERWFGDEILVHDKKSIRLGRATSGAMPLLFNHDFDRPVGMVTGVGIKDARMFVDSDLFSTDLAREVETMIDGGLHNVSIAYKIYVVEEEKKTGVFRVTDWEPYEVSIVTVPADPSVGIGRGVESEFEMRMVRQPAQRAITQEASMPEEKKDAGAVATVDPEITNEKIEAQRKVNAQDMEKARKTAIENLCKSTNLDQKYRDMWINSGASLEQVAKDVLDILEERGKANPMPTSKIGLTPREAQRFSIRKAAKAIMDNGDWKDAQFELECSREVAQRLGKVPNPSKFFVPFEVLEGPQSGKRADMHVADAASGGYLVSTENMGFIEMLRNRSVVFSMGARRLSGLVGNVTVPKQTGAGTAYWLASETAGPTESAQTLAQLSLTPKTVSAYTEISRQLLLQSSPSAEGIVTNDLAAIVALAADLAALNGSGSEQPVGILQTGGIGSVTGTTMAYAGILEFQTDVAAANVRPMAGGYVTTPIVAGKLMTRSRFSNTDTPLWVGNIWDGQMAGFRSMSSMQIPTDNMIFGDWSECVIGEWGVLEVEVNPYANFAAGIVGIRAMYSLDVAVRRPAAFSYAHTIT